jgi:hypothetical protein
MNLTTQIKSNVRAVARVKLLALTLISLAALPQGGGAQPGNQGNPGVLPAASHPFGKSYGEWADAWVQWAYSFPLSHGPVSDLTGELAGLGQSGNVWFLAGTFGGVAERTVQIPPGKALFFPIGEWSWVNLPDYGDNPWSPAQETYARGVLAEFVDDLENLTCQIDGREVRHIAAYRFDTPPGEAFMQTMPDDNSFGIPAGTYGPCVADGYWLMLAPLSNGQHTIHFTASQGSFDFSLEVTYHITIGR